jgi:hypothetical protein
MKGFILKEIKAMILIKMYYKLTRNVKNMLKNILFVVNIFML